MNIYSIHSVLANVLVHLLNENQIKKQKKIVMNKIIPIPIDSMVNITLMFF